MPTSLASLPRRATSERINWPNSSGEALATKSMPRSANWAESQQGFESFDHGGSPCLLLEFAGQKSYSRAGLVSNNASHCSALTHSLMRCRARWSSMG